MTELGIYRKTGPIILRFNNQGAIDLTKNPEFHARTKHIDIQHHFVRKIVVSGLMTVQHCPTNDMIADGLTKPLQRVKFERFVKQLGLTTEKLGMADGI